MSARRSLCGAKAAAGLAAAFAASPAGAQARLEVSEVWSSPPDMALASVDGVAEAPGGAIWVSDPIAVSVFAIDPQEGAVTLVARSGEGPGEVEAPDRIAVMPDGNMAVFDLSKVEVYTPGGESVRRIRLPIEVAWPKGFAALPSGGFAISGGIFSVSAAIHEFDAQGRLVRSWGDQSPAVGFRERIVGSGGALYAGRDGLLYSQSAPHRIVRYGYGPDDLREGRVLAELPDMLTHPGDGVIVESGEGDDWSRTFHPHFPQSRAVFELPDGRILNVVVRRDDAHSVWQVFESGALVAEGRADVPYFPWFLCDDGTVLATRLTPATDVPVVVRLRVSSARVRANSREKIEDATLSAPDRRRPAPTSARSQPATIEWE